MDKRSRWRPLHRSGRQIAWQNSHAEPGLESRLRRPQPLPPVPVRLALPDGDLHQCPRLCSAMTARVSMITALRLTTVQPERLACFYQELGFTVGQPEAIGGEEIGLLGLTGGGVRVPLRLGEQRVDLDSFDVQGRPYPIESTAADLCFQHFAIVTDDASAAWKHVAAIGGRPISADRPVQLPPSTGVAAAVKFRDPEGHPLELLEFPPPGADRWPGTGLVGIDHCAISVSDIDASCRFYEALGLSVRGRTLNQGPTQIALDGLPSVE